MCALSLGPVAPAVGTQPTDPLAGVKLGHEVSGQAAIDALGADLAKVANAHGKTTAELAKALKNDKSLRVDPKGRLLYKEAPLPADLAAEPAAPAPWSESGAYPLADTFKLHSRPGSRRTIYLDFDGHVMTGTAWNGGSVPEVLNCPPWDLDGAPGSFNDTERTRIQQIWQRVAEDYAPFDVNVTTEAPDESLITRSSTSDEYYGMRVLISPISSYFGTYGGIAYVGVFDHVGDYYKPALVFPENLANSEKYIAEAATHECGHTAGLLHDGVIGGSSYYTGHGSGETGWAPIMGVGYYRNLTQWSKGEYPNASNTEDDFVTAAANGLSARTDDHANTPTGALALPSGAFTVGGVIERTGDTDVVSFTCAEGAVSLAAATASLGSNLDVLLELRDEAGVLIAASNPLEQLAASLNANVPAGTYSVSVRGSGKGDLTTGYSQYGSGGAWKLTGTTPVSEAPVPPSARFTASETQGTAPLPVAFDGTGSSDMDGTIVSWAWSFGDGSTATGAAASHTYSSAGTYVVTLTVTDDTGLSDIASTTVTVGRPNSAPAANFTMTGGGTAPATVTFDGRGSSDADGSIVSWAWDFGDGGAGTGSVASHVFQKAGTYTVRLSVTDNDGAKTSTAKSITVDPAPAVAVYVDSISLSVATAKAGSYGLAKVRILDSRGLPVSGATVSGVWSGIVTGTSTGTTAADGTLTLKSKTSKKSGTITFKVNSVSKTGLVYDATLNTTTQVSMTLSKAPRAKVSRRIVR